MVGLKTGKLKDSEVTLPSTSVMLPPQVVNNGEALVIHRAIGDSIARPPLSTHQRAVARRDSIA